MKGLTKVSVSYPFSEGKKFDMDYYVNTHFAKASELMGDAIKKIEVLQGLGGGTPGSAPTTVAIGSIYFESVEAFQNAFGPHADAIMGDIPNFTDIEPVMQINQVML
jgi:uncharacterized protein (TIGR02118 family)